MQNHQPAHQPVYREPDPIPHPTVPPDLTKLSIVTQFNGPREALAARSDKHALLPLCFLPRSFSHENLSLDGHIYLKRNSLGSVLASKPLSMIDLAHFETFDLSFIHDMSTAQNHPISSEFTNGQHDCFRSNSTHNLPISLNYTKGLRVYSDSNSAHYQTTFVSCANDQNACSDVHSAHDRVVFSDCANNHVIQSDLSSSHE